MNTFEETLRECSEMHIYRDSEGGVMVSVSLPTEGNQRPYGWAYGASVEDVLATALADAKARVEADRKAQAA